MNIRTGAVSTDASSIVADNLHALESILRNRMTSDDVVYSRLERELHVSDTYLRRFHKEGQDVCINIINRLANRFNVNYELTNEEFFEPSRPFDAHSIFELRDKVRVAIKEVGVREAARQSAVSHTWVSKFANNKAEICFKRLHALSVALGIKYKFNNFPDQSFHIG